MTLHDAFNAILLGIVEGLTEFLPVSSTGHLILVGDLLGVVDPASKTFDIVIQLGAILAVCWVYRWRFTTAAIGLFRVPAANRFVFGLLIAFLPAAAVGVFAHGFIKSVLFNPYVVSMALIAGGFAIIAIERWVGAAKVASVDDFGYGLCFKIGLCQVVSMIPGVSRAGATILGAMVLGVERRAATEFSFFLAVPTMLGATAYDVYKNWSQLGDGWLSIAVGFVTAFVSAMFVVRTLIAFVGRHGFVPFAWYRIAVGVAMLWVLISR
jgi:undecaprenyl-diphosphatase